MTWRQPSKLFLTGLFVCCAVATLCALAVQLTVEETQAKVLHDRELLRRAEVIFPIGHYVVKREPGQIYRDRLDLAAGLWRENPRPIWLLAGLGSGMKESGAAIGKRYLVKKGVPADFILTVDELHGYSSSLDTTEEIGIASDLARRRGIDLLVVVGEFLHLAQARLVFDSYGVSALLAVTPEVSYGLRYQVIRTGTLLITLVDRRGWSLFWLRWIRKDWPNWPWEEY